MKKLYKLGAIMTALFMVGFVALSANAQVQTENKEVQVKIVSSGENSCTFADYELMQKDFSYSAQDVESGTPLYTCDMEKGGTDEWVTVETNNLVNPLVDQFISSTGVLIKHSTAVSLVDGDCELNVGDAVTHVLGDYLDVTTPARLFDKNDYTICKVKGNTQLKVNIPASLPVGLYTGDIIFKIY